MGAMFLSAVLFFIGPWVKYITKSSAVREEGRGGGGGGKGGEHGKWV